MAKIRSWLNKLKKLFVSDEKDTRQKEEKKRRWFLGRFKRKRLPAIAAPSVVKERKSFSEAEKEHSKHAWTTAVATAAAAEAAVASAQAAIEVVRIAGTQPYLVYKKCSRTYSAIRIQTAFRGYLAKKALRALRGVVRLQAIIRGQAVRRQVITTLNGLQTLVKIQSQLRVTKKSVGNEDFLEVSGESTVKKARPESDNPRGMSYTLPSRKDIDALFFSKREALIKRDRVKEYLLSDRGRKSNEKFNGRQDQCLGLEFDSQETKGSISATANFIVISKPMQRSMEGRNSLRLRDTKYNDPLAGRTSPITPPRRSFDKPKRSLSEESDLLSSPAVPNYMSATESARARLRSVSLPKQGLGSLDIYSDHGSPCKSRLSFSSVSTDAGTTMKTGKAPNSQQRSPTLKGMSGPIKSYQTAKDLSVDSDSSFLSWVRFNSLK